MNPPIISHKYFFNSVTIITFSVWPSPIFPCSFALQILSSCYYLCFSICIFFIPSLYLCPSLCYLYCLFIFSVSKTLSIPRMHKKAKRYQSLLPILSPLLLHAHSHLFTFVLQVFDWNSMVSLVCLLQSAPSQDQQKGQYKKLYA